MEIYRNDKDELTGLMMRVPVDPHTHLRDGDVLSKTISRSSAYFEKIMAMPNVSPPLTSVELCERYLERVEAVQEDLIRRSVIAKKIDIFAALYLTDQTSVLDIEKAAAHNRIIAGKLYPAGVTTGSASGVNDMGLLDGVFDAMERLNLPLSIHGEVSGKGFDIFERERIFVDTFLPVIVKKFPNLRIILEHVTTIEGAEFVKAHEKVSATVTPQHITYTRTDMLAGGMRSDLFCFPVLQTEWDRQAVLGLATSGRPDVFLGTDSAPHSQEKKCSGCAPGGFYDLHALDLYIKAFESVGAIEKLEDFASRYAAEFYDWELNEREIVFVKNESGIFISKM